MDALPVILTVEYLYYEVLRDRGKKTIAGKREKLQGSMDSTRGKILKQIHLK
jgi:hypothetical protein